MTRTRPTLVILGLVCLVLSAPVIAAAPGLSSTGDGTLTSTAEDLPEQTIRYDGNPGWVVSVDNNSTTQLNDWVNSSDERTLVSGPDATNRAVVAAPADHVGAGLLSRVLGTGLSTRDYVRTIEPEMAVSYIEPVSLKSNATYEAPAGARYTEFTNRGVEFSKSGMAFSEDADPTTLAEARNVTGSDRVASTGAGQLVATIDTGTNTADGTVFGNSSAGSDIRIHNASKSFISGESVNATAGNFSSIEDGNGHGTWVSSAVAANTSNSSFDGYAPDAELLVLKALDDEGSGSSHDIAQAIRYAADEDADVISMSLGSRVYSQEIANAVRYAEEQGSIVVIATGNSRMAGQQWVASPADTPGSVISVGAANASRNVSATLPSYFSQTGPDPGSEDLSTGVTEGEGVTVVAPGMEVTALTPTTSGTRREMTLSGTSMATPQVAGALAQALGEHPEWVGEPSTVQGYLANSSRSMPDATMAAAGNGYLAVDNMNETYSPKSQRLARTTDAEARDEGLRALSDSSGGLFFRALARVEGVF